MGTQHRLLTLILLIFILLLAAALRVCCLDAQSLWNDEGTSVALAERDLPTIARDAARDIHPPLYYWLLSAWTGILGTSEVAVRSLSALLGVVLVALTYALGRQMVGRWIGLVAALLAAVNPFQVYYSQEARMYILAAALTAGAVLALVRYVRNSFWPVLVLLVLLETAGIYVHYSFIVIIAILNLGYLLQPRSGTGVRRHWPWIASQGAVVLLYLPWLATALRQVTTWPTPAQGGALGVALTDTWRWLILGPTVEAGQAVVPLLVAGLVTVFGAVSLGLGWLATSRSESRWLAVLLIAWLTMPVALMLALGLYREAYLKFLLVTSPAVCLLLACGLLSPLGKAKAHGGEASRSSRLGIYLLRGAQALAAILILLASALSLSNYYGNPAYARDDYRGIASYIDAVGEPRDSILLNAPGQQEVFGYYYTGALPVFPLPEGRPLDPDATETSLAQLAQPGGRVFAILWATDESDPGRFIEGWLDRQTHKALDSWHGNVRMAVYAVPEQASPELSPGEAQETVSLRDPETGDMIELLGYHSPDERLAAGDIAQITLYWRADQTPSRRYKVFLHLLDEAGHIVGQRDTEPGGGARLTTTWSPGETVPDNHGVLIHPATPPGSHRLEVGLYDAETGVRLVTPVGEGQIWLEPVLVERPAAPAPVEALGMQHRSDASYGELTLLGYGAHKLGFAHDPDEPILPGDVVRVDLYWRADAVPMGDWQAQIGWQDPAGNLSTVLTTETVVGYPTSRWQAGDVWRGQFSLPVPLDAAPGQYRVWVRPLPVDGSRFDAFLSEHLTVEP